MIFKGMVGKTVHLRVMTVLCSGMFMAILDVNAVNIASLSLFHEFHTSISELTWVVDSYNLTLGGFMLGAGAFSDKFGAKRVWITGLLIFVMASLGCSLSFSIWQLIGFRLTQGVGAALFIPASFSLILAIWQERTVRQQAIGMFGGMVAVAAAVGPVLAGILIEHFGWRSLFLINIPVGVYGAWYARQLLPETSKVTTGPLDICGWVFSFFMLACLSFVLIEWPLTYISSTWLWGVLLSGVLCLISFIVVEKRHHSPMLPLSLFHSLAFNLANLTGFFINACYFGGLYALSLMLQQHWHDSPQQTGLMLSPLAICLMFGNILAGRTMARWGVKRQMMLGLLLSSIGYLGIAHLTGHLDIVNWASFVLLAGGVAFVVPPMTAVVLHHSPLRESGRASAVHMTIRQNGSLLGIAFASLIMNISGVPVSLLMEISFAVQLALVVILGGCLRAA
ncbi:MAG: Antiseptic resistance protein [Candidatus Celerinatantimonas neptuna]|nr:MAG: Antiseptic resistance protein [Candidatus Celerinatantimonas neptuna]